MVDWINCFIHDWIKFNSCHLPRVQRTVDNPRQACSGLQRTDRFVTLLDHFFPLTPCETLKEAQYVMNAALKNKAKWAGWRRGTGCHPIEDAILLESQKWKESSKQMIISTFWKTRRRMPSWNNQYPYHCHFHPFLHWMGRVKWMVWKWIFGRYTSQLKRCHSLLTPQVPREVILILSCCNLQLGKSNTLPK